MAYVKGQPFIPQFTDPATGLLMTSGTIEFYLTGTSTPTPYYTDSAGTSGGTSLTLDSGGQPSTDIYFDTGITYKLVVKNAAGATLETIDPFNVNYGASSTADLTHAEDATTYTLSTYLQNRHVANVKDFGAVGDDATDDYTAINNAYNSGAKIVYFPETPSSRYKIDTGLTPPNGVILLGAGTGDCRIRYTGTGAAVTLGTSTTVLNKGCGIKGLKIELQDKASKGIHLVGTDTALLEDLLIEGLYTPYDNTRTNIGVHIDGADVSSFFNMLKNVNCTHIHESYRIQTTGTLQSTCNYFLNCTALGDQATDNSSIGYNIGGGAVVQEGQGSVISGGNVELCNTGFLVGANAGNVTVQGVRIEISISGTAWKFDFVDGCDPWTLVGNQGLGNSYMEANSGIRNWDSANHTLIGDDNGSLRLAGFDGALNNTQFIGIGGTNPEIRHNANSELYIYSMGDASDTGRTLIQQGYGSATHGAHIDLSGASHATRPGDCTLGPSSTTGVFKVNAGLNGTTYFEVRPQLGQINMTVPTSSAGLSAGDVWNDAGTLKIV